MGGSQSSTNSDNDNASSTTNNDNASHTKPGSLEKDNPTHREWSNKLDDKLTGNAAYDKVARPVIHGTYHGVRYAGSGNEAEWAQAKDQFSKVGTGQARTDYLAQHRAEQRQESSAENSGKNSEESSKENR